MTDITARLNQLINTRVEHVNGDGVVKTMTFQSLNADKVGTLKSGDKAPYVMMVDEEGQQSDMHPEIARKLLANGENKGYKLLADLTKTAEEVVTPTAELKPLTTEEQQQVNAADEQVNAAPVVSLKQRFVALFTVMHAEGKARKEVKAAAQQQFTMSDACFNTYYQNCKSGMWS